MRGWGGVRARAELGWAPTPVSLVLAGGMAPPASNRIGVGLKRVQGHFKGFTRSCSCKHTVVLSNGMIFFVCSRLFSFDLVLDVKVGGMILGFWGVEEWVYFRCDEPTARRPPTGPSRALNNTSC